MESKFSKEEVQNIKNKISQIGSYMQKNDGPWIWDTYLKITGVKEKQPCYCKTSGVHWKKAIDAIHNFVKEYDNR